MYGACWIKCVLAFGVKNGWSRRPVGTHAVKPRGAPLGIPKEAPLGAPPVGKIVEIWFPLGEVQPL